MQEATKQKLIPAYEEGVLSTPWRWVGTVFDNPPAPPPNATTASSTRSSGSTPHRRPASATEMSIPDLRTTSALPAAERRTAYNEGIERTPDSVAI